ncbi:LPS-assembly protein LptD [Pseudomonas oryzihabitans]|uniref:LPS-assembly protein LptD n=1 Tax=Pseudomonas oryzihabitans TaxID=47885 RepID=UPI002893891E|nr:LPS-assembly protein LptD [Pseudomonas oryzihabitans]MDT3722311.1 LPS-assembly protein LptD [Pseudomonas oryzihabitans]
MAVKTPAFRRKFPLLVTGSLLAMQPVTALIAAPAEQFSCSAGAGGGWSCNTQAPAAALPPRPSKGETAGVAAQPAARKGDAAVLVTESKGRALKSRSADYSHLDWVPRDRLTAAQLAETAPYCSGAYVEPVRPGMYDDTPTAKAPTYVSAKASRYEQEQQVATLAGDVVLRQGGMQVESQEANLHQLENRGELKGNVRFRDNGLLMVGDKADMQLDNGQVQVDNAEFVMHQSHARGSALYAKRGDDAIIRLKDGTYTTCEPGSNAWQVKGNTVTLNPATGLGYATNATLRVKDIPVLYTPFIYFPIDDRRQSGFLAPSISTSSDTGFAITTPYYFNLAPNYDATLYPRFMAKHGLQTEGEFRYLTRSSEGQVYGSYLKDSDPEHEGEPEATDNRWLYGWKNRSGLDSRLMAEVDYTRISDPYYFQDLDTDLGINKPTYVNQQGRLTYRGDTFTAALNMQAYQLATVSDVTPYNRLPQLTVNGALPYHPGGLDFTYDTEAVRFERSFDDNVYFDLDDNGNQTNIRTRPDVNIFGLARANGNRYNLAPGMALPMTQSWGFLTPAVRYYYTQYDLDLDTQGQNQIAQSGGNYDSSPSRSVPLFSLDSGLYFDRSSNLFGEGGKQTLEPRAKYLYVPYRDQSDIPVFDTGEYTFSYSSLWRDNRFTGADRMGDANQIALGATSRFIEPNGFERANVSFGELFYFRDREVQLPGLENELPDDATTSRSPYALAGMYRFNRDWRVNGEYNWDPVLHHTDSGSVMFHYQPETEPGKVLNVGYRYRDNVRVYDPNLGRFTYNSDDYKIDQHDISFIWPIVPQWSAIARWQFDYNKSRTLEAFGGFEYDNCCWKLRLISRYWLKSEDDVYYTSQSSQADRGVFLQIVLKGLGNVFGGKTEGFLDRGIQGYREREDQAM